MNVHKHMFASINRVHTEDEAVSILTCNRVTHITHIKIQVCLT
jgi:hypothetical protein